MENYQNRRVSKARTPHTCTLCNNAINKGDHYLYHSTPSGEGWTQHKTCGGCAMAIVDAYYECQGIAKPMNAEPIANRKKTKTKTNKARALRSVLREL